MPPFMQVFLLLAVLTIVADGTVFTAQCDTRANCTAVLQQALNRGGGVVDTVIVPYNNNSEPYQTAPLFIQRNNFKLVLEPGVVLEAMAGSFKGTNDCLITAEMVANVSVVAAGAVLRMRRPYLPPAYVAAEWRHVLSIRGSTNFTWDGGTLADSGGDGVEVSGGYKKNFSSSVTLRGLSVIRAWRNGLSVISVKKLLVEDCSFKDTSGTDPQFGIDLEPDVTPYGYMEGVVFRRIQLIDNLNGGFTMGLYGLVGEPGADEGVSIIVDGMNISGSYGANASLAHRGVGMQLSNYPVGEKPGKLAAGSIVMHDVKITNCSASGLDIENWSRGTISLTMDNLAIGNVGTQQEYWPGHPSSGPPVPIALPPYDDTPAHMIGGVHFGPRAAQIDMTAITGTPTSVTRPWLSVTSLRSPVGMADVTGAAVVRTRNASMCEAATGHNPVNVSIAVDCRVAV